MLEDLHLRPEAYLWDIERRTTNHEWQTKSFIYGPRELQVADFGISDGKVSYIWLKNSDFWLKEGK